MRPANILVVDDEPSMVRYLRTLLEVDAHQVEEAHSGEEALARVERDPAPELVLLDLLMPGMDGLETLEKLRAARPALKVVMLSCVTEPRKIVQAIRLGAYDYLTKPFHKAELDSVLDHLLSAPPPSGEPDPALAEASHVDELSDDLCFLAANPAMRKIRAQVAQLAEVDVPILILGESGTGKEVVARLVHKLSGRAHRPFLKLNCAALPGELLESELFGYEPGAFTGATRPKPGKFELAHRGTIFLDEIAEMPTFLQAKLLHVLQDQQFSRLGGRTSIQVDVRVLAATNVDVERAMATKKFREDLYYRLNAFTVMLPPLRERREEIPLLLKHFMGRFSTRYARAPLPFSPQLLDACVRYPWPGNLRELENLVKRYLIMGDEALVIGELEAQPDSSPLAPSDSRAEVRPAGLKSLVRSLKDEAEMEAIKQALEQARWSRKEAARLLNISYKALLYKMRQYGITPEAHSRSRSPLSTRQPV
jgi:DNA-binding NtrC family response regulator